MRNAYKTAPSARMESVSLEDGARVSTLLDYYGIAYERAHILVVNRQIATLETALNDKDEVRVVPLAAGG